MRPNHRHDRPPLRAVSRARDRVRHRVESHTPLLGPRAHTQDFIAHRHRLRRQLTPELSTALEPLDRPNQRRISSGIRWRRRQRLRNRSDHAGRKRPNARQFPDQRLAHQQRARAVEIAVGRIDRRGNPRAFRRLATEPHRTPHRRTARHHRLDQRRHHRRFVEFHRHRQHRRQQLALMPSRQPNRADRLAREQLDELRGRRLARLRARSATAPPSSRHRHQDRHHQDELDTTSSLHLVPLSFDAGQPTPQRRAFAEALHSYVKTCAKTCAKTCEQTCVQTRAQTGARRKSLRASSNSRTLTNSSVGENGLGMKR